MKCTVLTTLLAVFLLAAGARSASATEVGYNRKIGLGFILGDPTGLSGKYWVGPTNAFDFGLGFTNYGTGIGTCYTDNNGIQHCQGYFETTHQRRLPLAVEHRPWRRPARLVHRRRRPREGLRRRAASTSARACRSAWR